MADIVRLVRIERDEPGLDDHALLDRLVSAGVERNAAWRLITFVPLAFGRVAFDGLKVRVPATHIQHSVRGKQARRRLRDEAEFRAAADHVGDFSNLAGFNGLILRSSAVVVVNKAMNAGSKAEDLVLTEAITWDAPD